MNDARIPDGAPAAPVDPGREALALARAYASAQSRCSELLAGQAREIARLEAAVVRLRGALLARDTALDAVRDELAALRACRASRPATAASSALPAGAPGPVLRPEAVLRLDRSDLDRIGAGPAPGAARADPAGVPDDGLAALEASLVAADLVICQTGCASHDAYWRVRDHCRRTGKPCVLADRPDALDAVRARPVEPAARPEAAGGAALPDSRPR